MALLRHVGIIVTLLCAATPTDAQPPAIVDDYYDIGKIHHKVSTESPIAQRWFDRGLAMCIGFNHEEAVRCFEKALQSDPGLAMAYWGMAYAWGPNMNNMEIVPHQIAQAHTAAKMAMLHRDNANGFENHLIKAVSTRYAVPVPADRTELNQAYAEAMADVYQKFPDEPLAATLYAESMINLQPWKHFAPDGTMGTHTATIIEVLEQGLAKWPDHPALCHLYIHTMEASPDPGKALDAAHRLRKAVPGSGHLVHMPSHIYVLLGMYDDVIATNQRAIIQDKEFRRREGDLNFYSLYRIHNYHFVTYGAMFDGRYQVAMRAARELTQQVPEEMLRAQVDFLDAFMPTPLHVMVRFGKWDEILAEPEPAEFLPVSRSIWHYARALAFAATGRVEEAIEEKSEFDETADSVPETSFLFQNPSRSILEIADVMIEGEIAYRQGQFGKAFELLEEAVRRDDALNYDEPWGWMQPTRHALGALLLEQGQAAASELVYREDLRRHPKNPWSLHGLAEALRRQGKQKEATKCQAAFQKSSARTDVSIDRSCYCRLETE